MKLATPPGPPCTARRTSARAAVLLTTLLAAAAPVAAQSPAVCQLIAARDLTAASGSATGRLTADAPGTLTRAQVPALPADLRIEQCTGAVRPSGAVSVRIGVLSAERALTPAEWQRVEKALEEPGEKPPPGAPQRIGGALCWKHSWKTRQVLHESACSGTKGRWHVTVGWEHEDPAQLPDAAAVSALLAKALAALP